MRCRLRRRTHRDPPFGGHRGPAPDRTLQRSAGPGGTRHRPAPQPGSHRPRRPRRRRRRPPSHGTGTVRLTAAVHEGRLRLCVTDEGSGFPPEFLPRAFDRFARAEASRTGEGSGLGLAFVQAVATAHGGTAHAENTEHGVCVVLALPC
ncbi:sensor histidine kinase [Streptomyces sp. NBC_01571]|uniref:sensor histidine kinase n=1 Tax=Streptomyces sp. NBC_01571 TaxID=2975883 RepID=UPI0022557A0C|nr:sensor histidine kinase [Streptomyces sp. NBC_01571]MCX4578079.1 sensor histidine kinase [Streptomyces sp. NBC_01571]